MLVDIAADHAGIEFEEGDGAIAMAGGTFGSIYRLVHRQVAPGEAWKVSRMRSQRSAWFAPLISAVEAMAPALTIGLNGRLLRSSKAIELKASPEGSTPILPQHLLAPMIFEREAVNDRLRDRLDGEQRRGVARLIEVAVHGGERDAEQVGIDARQLGDVVCELAAAVLFVPAVQILQIMPDGKAYAEPLHSKPREQAGWPDGKCEN